jgi:hypothetical protein
MDVSRFSRKHFISVPSTFLWIIIICYIGTERPEDHRSKLLLQTPDSWTDLQRINNRPPGEGRRGENVEEEKKIELTISTQVAQFELWNKMQEPPEHNQSRTPTDLITVRSGRKDDRYNVHI